MKKNLKKKEIPIPTNDAMPFIEMSASAIYRVKIKGTADYLYHRFSVESVEERNNAKKGSVIKKTDDIESYVYRDEKGYLFIPREQFRMCIIGAAKYKTDPRSKRKSAMDLYKASIVVLNDSNLGTKDWDYLDKRRVVIQQSAIARTRPALYSGWEATFDVEVLLTEYISEIELLDTIVNGGKLSGIGDFRPSFGRFQVVGFQKIT
jgi:hypothetical protein